MIIPRHCEFYIFYIILSNLSKLESYDLFFFVSPDIHNNYVFTVNCNEKKEEWRETVYDKIFQLIRLNDKKYKNYKYPNGMKVFFSATK